AAEGPRSARPAHVYGGGGAGVDGDVVAEVERAGGRDQGAGDAAQRHRRAGGVGAVVVDDVPGAAARLVVSLADGVQAGAEREGRAGHGREPVVAVVVHDLRAVQVQETAVVAVGGEGVTAGRVDLDKALEQGGGVVAAGPQARGQPRDRRRAVHRGHRRRAGRGDVEIDLGRGGGREAEV